MNSRLAIACAAVVLLTAAPAPAAAPNAEARVHYDSGIAHYNLAEYKEALVDFKDAYRLVHDAALLFNIAQCYRQLHDPEQAIVFYRSFRREYPGSPNRAEIDRLISEMERAIEEKRTAQPPTGVQPPTAAGARPSPGPAVQSPEPPAARVAPAADAVVAKQPPQRSIAKKPWLWATVVVVAAVAATGIALGVVYGNQTRDPKPSTGSVDGN